MPNVSLIITTHNRLELLKRAIESARVAGTGVELIVVDDASSDGTEVYCGSLDGIKYVRLETNVRTAGARNAGIEAGSAPYITFLDDDDLRLPGSLDKQVSMLENDANCGLVYGQFLFSDQAGELLDQPALPTEFPEGDVFWQLLEKNFLGCLTVVFRRSVLERVGPLDTSPHMYGIEDLDLWIRIAEHFELRSVKEPVAVYREPVPDSNQWYSDAARQYMRIRDAYKSKWLKLDRVKALDKQPLEALQQKCLRSISETMLYDMAHGRKGSLGKLRNALMAIKCYPANLGDPKFYKTVTRTIVLR